MLPMDQIRRTVTATLKGGVMIDRKEKSEIDYGFNMSNDWSEEESFKKRRSWKDPKLTRGLEYLMLQLMCDTS